MRFPGEFPFQTPELGFDLNKANIVELPTRMNVFIACLMINDDSSVSLFCYIM